MWRDMHPAPTLNSAEAPEFFLNNVLFNDLKVDNSIWNTSYPFSMLSLATFGKKYTIEQDLIQFNLGGCAGIPATLASCDVQDGDSLVDLGVSDREDVWAYFYVSKDRPSTVHLLTDLQCLVASLPRGCLPRESPSRISVHSSRAR